MHVRLPAAILLVMALGACSGPWADGGCTAQVDWVDFVEVGSVQYVAGPSSTELTEGDLGPVHARVRARLQGVVCDPQYRPRDGDAAFLEPQTPLYEVTGRPVSEQLAAHRGSRIVVYSRVGGPAPAY